MSVRTTPSSYSTLESLESRTLLASDYRIIDLGTLGGDTSVATAINDRGQVVGYSTTEDGQTRAFFYHTGRMRSIGSPKGESRALDISNRGHVGGYFINNSGSARGFVWRQKEFTVMEDLIRKGARNSLVYAVEKNGDAYGQSSNRPVVWRDADPRALSVRNGAVFNVSDRRVPVGELQNDPMSYRPPLRLDNDTGRALGINNNREIVGWQFVGGDDQAVLWKLSASREFVLDMEIIGGLAENPGTNAAFSTANAINDDGIVVGSSMIAPDSEGRSAFVWQDGEIEDLNDLLDGPGADDWALLSANDINERGQIVGTGIIGGEEHAFLLEPVAEGPDVRITLNGREIEDGDTVNFGTVGRFDPPETREFVIRNEGRERLRIRDIDVPRGFQLLDELPRYLDPGEAESFRIRLLASEPGIFRGAVTITTTDPDERRFDINVEGRVSDSAGIFDGVFDGFPTGRR